MRIKLLSPSQLTHSTASGRFASKSAASAQLSLSSKRHGLFLTIIGVGISPGIETYFSWDLRDSFVPQPDGSLFSRTERYQCVESIVESIVSPGSSILSACPASKALR
jgi:hypothetical protein